MLSYATSNYLLYIIDKIDEQTDNINLRNDIKELRNTIQMHSYVVNYFAINNNRAAMYADVRKNNIIFIPKQHLCKICYDNNIHSKASLGCGAITFGESIYENYYCEYHATYLFYNEANRYIYLKEIISPVPQIYISTFLNECIKHNNRVYN